MENDNATSGFVRVSDGTAAPGANVPQPAAGACPHCGYCPHCGRGGQQAVPPYQPYGPWTVPYTYPPFIVWSNPNVTICGQQ